MPNVLESICVAVASGECLLGILANGFIALVSCIGCIKTRRVTSVDFILTGLAISRSGTLWALITIDFFVFFYFKRNATNIWIYSEFIWNLSNHSSAWFGSCLSMFYFLKIANFSHPVFLWLKWRINKVVLRVLMGCLLISLLVILPMTKRITEIHIDQENQTNIKNNNRGFETLKFSTLILFNTGGLVPFALSIISSFLLVLSLWRHTQQMHLKVTDSRDPSTEAHVRAMKSMTSFLFLFVLYHLGIAVAVLNMTIFYSKLVVMLSLIIMSVYPMAHSIIIILAHSKLRQAFLKVVGKLKDSLKVSGKV